MEFVPFIFGVVGALKDFLEGLFGDFLVFLVACGDGELAESHCGESVAEDVVGVDDRLAFTGDGEVPVEVAVVAVFFHEFSAEDGGVKPFLTFFNLVVEHGEHPYFTALEPHEFVGVEHTAVAFEAGEVAAILFVERVVEPERQDVVEEFVFVLFSKFLEVSCHIVKWFYDRVINDLLFL